MRPLIYLVRHGQVETGQPRRFLGQGDPPLSEAGEEQARRLALALGHIRFAGVYASPLQRAVETARIICGEEHDIIGLIEAFKEINLGAWEGLCVEEVRRRFPGAYEARGERLASYRPEGGESFQDLAERCLPALLGFSEQQGPLLMVAHAGVNRVILSTLLGKPLERALELPQPYCAVNILGYDGGRFQVLARSLDEEHLHCLPHPSICQASTSTGRTDLARQSSLW